MTDSPTTTRKFLSAVLRPVLAIACFAAAAAILFLCLDVRESTNTVTWTKAQARTLMLFLFGPAIGTLAGLGIGIVIRRPIIATLVGLLVPALIDAAVVGYLWIT